MTYCYFAHFRNPLGDRIELAEHELSDIAHIISRVSGLSRALMHIPVPGGASHAFPHDEAAPPLVVQLYAPEVEIIEEALRPHGALQALVAPKSATGLQRLKLQQQIMLVRRLTIDPIESAHMVVATSCSYLVHYPGQADDLSAWHRHYIDCHPPIMRKFPRVREIEICTRLDWIGGLPGMRVDFMQRNKLMFDSASELSAALSSPVIKEMRADFHTFPEFAGGNVHYPMLTRSVPVTNATV